MATIVSSILLAFAVQAWWEGRKGRATQHAYEQLLGIQMASNAEILRREVRGGDSSAAALDAAILAISPDPGAISSDSLFSLMARGWKMSDLEFETSALESLLGLDTFEPLARPVLYSQMVRFRSEVGRLGRNTERFVEARGRVAVYLTNVSPLPGFWLDAPDPDGGFPVPTDELLRDQRLEGLLQEVSARQQLRSAWAADLLVLADSITSAIGR